MTQSSPNEVVSQRFEFERALRRERDDSSWLVRDRQDGRHYVLRYLPGTRIGEHLEQHLERLCRPLHPAVVRPYEWAAGDRRLAIWRPYIEGPDSGSLTGAPLERILATAQRVSEALHSAHSADLAHGALKAANIILNESRGVMLVDFAPQTDVAPGDDIVALGELLYQWLTDSACTRDGDDEALAARLRQDLRPELKVPPQLGMLLVAMLAADERRRPRSMGEVNERIDDLRVLLAGTRPRDLEDDWAQASFLPPPVATAAAVETAGSPSAPTAARRRSRLPVALALAVILAAIVTVVAYLPERVEQQRQAPPPEVAAAAPAEPAPQAAPEPPSREQLEALLQLREQAQQTLDAFINLQLELQEQQVERWAGRRFETLVARVREGDEPFRQQQFEAAEAIYAGALGGLQEIAAMRPQVFSDALAQGAAALDAGNSAAAGEAFSLALAIDPESRPASVGLERARVLDEVLALLAQAESAERQNDLELAAERYAQILELDDQTGGAADALARVRSLIVDRDFRRSMSRALAALRGGDFAAARAAFANAEAIRPGSRAVEDGLIELERRIRDDEIATLQVRASKAVAEERWEAAGRHYQRMLKLDSNLALAQQGLRQARDREDLERRLISFTVEPSRWWSDAGRAEATSLLYDAEGVAGAGPRLKAQISELRQQLDLAGRPVEVTLVSDQACDVVVYKIARLGQFQSTRLRLLPGRYTAVGTRNGYRDVRREFLVSAGGNPEPVSLRCQEQVFAGGP